jgi:hypothetical protein
MPRQVKPKTESTETVVAPVVAPVVADGAKTQKPKKASKPKTESASAPAVDVVSVTAPAPAPVVDESAAAAVDVAPVPEGDVADLVAQSTEFITKLNQLGTLFASLKTEFRTLEKKWSRELKTAQKSQSKRKRKSGNRQPSGFVKPTKISDELAKFLDKPSGSEMARTSVTREINQYIREHNLQDSKNGRKINFDSKLQALLKLNPTDELTYFNLQRFMSPHFAKTEKVEAH